MNRTTNKRLETGEKQRIVLAFFSACGTGWRQAGSSADMAFVETW